MIDDSDYSDDAEDSDDTDDTDDDDGPDDWWLWNQIHPSVHVRISTSVREPWQAAELAQNAWNAAELHHTTIAAMVLSFIIATCMCGLEWYSICFLDRVSFKMRYKKNFLWNFFNCNSDLKTFEINLQILII